MRDPLSLAEGVAENVLFPNALDTDRSKLVPAANLDALAEAGLYGLFGPESDGGFGADLRTAAAVVERVASGCLTTALVWLQHHALVGSLLFGPEPLRNAWLAEVTTGKRRSGIVFTGLIPGPSTLNATRQGDKWVLDGQAPWVSGWGRIDTLQVAARGPEETIVTVALDQLDRPDLSAEPHRLAVLNASGTVKLAFDGLVVEDDRVLSVAPHDPGSVNGVALRLNGSLALGVTRRCCSLIGPSALDDQLEQVREQLDGADGAEMARARGAASRLSTQAATALAVHTGSRSIEIDNHAQRLAREAMFILVFASRPDIKDAILAGL